jgi:phospholipase/lecithinase/hemolysin
VANLDAFAQLNPDAVVKLIDSEPPFVEAINNPTKYGAPDNLCENMDGVSCLWWDNLHPGVAIQRLLAENVAAAWPEFF